MKNKVSAGEFNIFLFISSYLALFFYAITLKLQRIHIIVNRESVIGMFECANIPDYGIVKGRYKSLLDSNIFYVEECFNFA